MPIHSFQGWVTHWRRKKEQIAPEKNGSTEQDNKITNKVYYYIGCSCRSSKCTTKLFCQISANLTNLFCQISNYLSYFWRTFTFFFMKTQAYVPKNSLYVSWSSIGSVIVIVEQICSTSNFLTQQRPKKMILSCQSLKSHWIHWLITPVSKTSQGFLCGTIIIRTNVSAVPLTLFQFRLLHLKARKEVQSWFILRLYTAQITWNVIPHVIDS